MTIQSVLLTLMLANATIVTAPATSTTPPHALIREDVEALLDGYLPYTLGGEDLLAAKIENGKVIMWGEGDDPTGVYTPAPAWRLASWLSPLLLVSAAALLMTALAWPIAALVRRHYGATLPEGVSAQAYLLSHIAAVSQAAVIVAWLTVPFWE